MLFREPQPEPTPLRAAVRAAIRLDESVCVAERLPAAIIPAAGKARIATRAIELVEAVRAARTTTGGIDAFMQEYDLTSHEGVTLMCLAEALLRVPDAETADELIKDKIGGADWENHMGQAASWFVNASTWALMLTGRVLELEQTNAGWRDVLGQMITRSGEPVIRQAVTQAMRILGRQFVLGRTIDEALGRARREGADGTTFSYDMLGEAARTMADAERYVAAYANSIEVVGKTAGGRGPLAGPGISVKLSALHPRFEQAQAERVRAELLPRLLMLAHLAKSHDIGLTVDAEEADRLDLSLDLIEAVALDPELAGWDGFGLAVQAYQKRAAPLLDWLEDLADRSKRRLMVRLVKGAYWDSEIKLAQVEGLHGYPVFTRKPATDVSYLACVRRLFAAPAAFFPAFASHNAQTVASVLELAGGSRAFEFQRLHGMGKPLYDALQEQVDDISCRVYAPVGGHEDLLAYLVRRLLENGANTSFVNRIVDEAEPVAELVADPAAEMQAADPVPHPAIVLPRHLYGVARANARGFDLNDPATLAAIDADMDEADTGAWSAAPLIDGVARAGEARPVSNPADRGRQVGSVVEAGPADALVALEHAAAAQAAWDTTPAGERADCLRRTADLYEAHMPELMALAVREAGKTLRDAVAEVREAVDFLRYYAWRAEAEFAAPAVMPGPTGEENLLALHGRGAFLCISPWNFPLAIFTGQVAAALAAGNSVLAKPAEQTPLIAARAVALMHAAGIPKAALQLLPGDGPTVAAPLLGDPRLAGVAFTGSTETARSIQRRLADRDGPIVPFVAETGGLNAMIVDSTALPEQVVRDVLASAFQSAGQRCSALRVLYVQADVADGLIGMLAGAMAELAVGDPALLATDVGPVIDEDARDMLLAHIARMQREGRLIGAAPLGEASAGGCFVAPHAFEIDDIARIGGEKFGPVLHVIRYQAAALDEVVDEINASGYGLTLGVHSRIQATADRIADRARVGNLYVNRNQIGAVVGVQPFGGEGLSGTGPKAGGPHYLHRFAVERVRTTDTTAVGGNAALMALADDQRQPAAD